MSPTLDDLVATLPAPGAPPIQLHLHGTLALIIQADGATVYVNGPVILRYLQSVAPVLQTAERLGPEGLDRVDALLAEQDQIDTIFGNRSAFDGLSRVEKVRVAVAECARMHAALGQAQMEATGAAHAEANHRAEAASRIRTLAHALHTYGEHAHGCVEGDPINEVTGCTCGLSLVLASEPDPYEIGEGQPTSE